MYHDRLGKCPQKVMNCPDMHHCRPANPQRSKSVFPELKKCILAAQRVLLSAVDYYRHLQYIFKGTLTYKENIHSKLNIK